MSETGLTTTFELGGAVTRDDGGDSAAEPSLRRPVAEALGQSLRLRPGLWLAATLGVAAFLWLFAETAYPPIERASWADWMTVAFIGYGLVAIVVVPHVIIPRSSDRVPESRVALMRWSLALMPFLGGFTGLAAGAHPWSMALAFVTTTLLLVYTAAGVRQRE
jgi:hypothetical protein